MSMRSNPRPALEEIFHGALEHPAGGAREAYVDGACGGDVDLRRRVQALLDSHVEAADFLELPMVDPSNATNREAAPGMRIGPYKLLQEIGEGGMGIVYMAEQEQPVRRMVALKIIKLGMDTKQVIARFEAERQALALMEHPNIARVLDAGATESGRPYFVMELVRGVAINEYCDKHQLPTAERMRLFMDTCRAVQHAHQKGIIHRDIKPGNVLVTSHDKTPVVKIIDFGVAKATHQKLTEKTLFTEFRQFIGTPEYMSPEQAEMSGLDVDTRTDIYSLGVLLYQLLTGSTPFDAKTLRNVEYGEMTRMIREDEPPIPSTRISKLGAELEALARNRHSDPSALVKLMRGDIDWIVMKAIAKDRTRRYDSASELADDVGRHLRSEPVLAGPPSAIYRTRKLIQRNRGLVFAVTLTTLGLLTGLGMALSGYFAAKAEAERSNQISTALTGLLGVAGGTDVLDVDVDALLATAREAFGEDHSTVAATLSAMAAQLRNAGDPRRAEALYLEALSIYRATYGEDHRTVGQTLASLGAIQALNGEMQTAEASLRGSLRIEALQPGQPSMSGCSPRRELARILSARGEHSEAEQQLGDALTILRASDSAQHFEVFTVLDELLATSVANPRHGDLDPLYRELVATAEQAFTEGHFVRAMAKFSRAMYLGREERPEAEAVVRDALTELDGMDSPPLVYVASTLDMLFQTLRNREDPAGREECDETLMRFLELAPQLWGPDQMILAENYNAAMMRFSEHGRTSMALEFAKRLLDFAWRAQDPGKLDHIAKSIGGVLWKSITHAEISNDDLERVLDLLDSFPTENGFAQRVEVLRAITLERLGRGEDVLSVLTRVRELTSPDDYVTLDLLSLATAYIEDDH